MVYTSELLDTRLDVRYDDWLYFDPGALRQGVLGKFYRKKLLAT